MTDAKMTPVYMSDKVYDRLVGLLRESYKDACVLYIDRVSNPKLEAAFNSKQAAFGANANERELFHGSSAAAIGSITNNGYDAAYNKRAAFGPGTYFSSAASYSKDYADVIDSGESYMIVNRVLLGTHTVSAGGTYSGDSGGDGKTIFVTRHNDASLPTYVICFHRNARA